MFEAKKHSKILGFKKPKCAVLGNTFLGALVENTEEYIIYIR